MPLAAGAKLGPYQIVAPIGAGGMGEVFRARDERLGREVAIKVLPAAFHADSDRLRRFGDEARAAGSLNHPGILVVYDVGEHDGAPYIVSELLDGQTLRERLTTGRLSPRKALDIAVQIAEALAGAHDKGIIHHIRQIALDDVHSHFPSKVQHAADKPLQPSHAPADFLCQLVRLRPIRHIGAQHRCVKLNSAQGIANFMCHACRHLPQSRQSVLPFQHSIFLAHFLPQRGHRLLQTIVRLLQFFRHLAVGENDSSQLFDPLGCTARTDLRHAHRCISMVDGRAPYAAVA